MKSRFTCKYSKNIGSRDLRPPITLKVYGILSVNFSPVTNFYNENSQNTVFNTADDSVIAYPVFPEFTQFGTFKCLTDTARIVKQSQTPWRNVRARREIWGSCLYNSRTAAGSNSIFQAITVATGKHKHLGPAIIVNFGPHYLQLSESPDPHYKSMDPQYIKLGPHYGSLTHKIIAIPFFHFFIFISSIGLPGSKKRSFLELTIFFDI